MKDTFYLREAHRYFKKCGSLFLRKASPIQEQYYPFIAEKDPKDYYGFPPEHVRPIELSGSQLIEALNASFPSSSLYPNNQTYYVMDISQHKETPYNTIMYQLNETPQKSMETTTVIMNRYFEANFVSYSFMRKFGETLGYKRTYPYILGEIYFIPERGASKQSASWYALHHVMHYQPSLTGKELMLFSNQHPILTLSIKKSKFEKQLDQASHMYFT